MLSIIIPFYNERENIPTLIHQIKKALGQREYEVILVDDGSTDGLEKGEIGEGVTLLKHRVRQGKGAALRTGVRESKGSIVIFMDGDLQDDPADIEKFLEKIDEGYDVVSGWRKNRKDKAIMSGISKVGNILVWRKLLNSPLHDVNCGYKAFRRDVLNSIPLYGDNFRFLALSAAHKGYKIGEVVVNNRAREHGSSKYTPTKALFGLLDTITTYFIYRFAEKPLHFFGIVGGGFFGIGFIIALYLSYERLFYGVLLYRRPALLLAVLLIIIGIQIVMTGIVAELQVYLYNSKMRKRATS